MCSFLFTNVSVNDFDYTNHYMKFRGPDHTNSVTVNGEYTIAHNILSITGDFTPQPFIDNESEIVCTYNGEIYNQDSFGKYKSDGECIIPTYMEYGTNAFSELDGEFAIVLADFKNNLLHLVTDPFATKPLWYAISNDKIAVATYESAVKSLGFVNALKLEANTILTFNLETKEIISKKILVEFSTKQYINSFDPWINAFEESIRKRTKNIREKIFIGLSSGYDSGAISCELTKQNVPHTAYAVVDSDKENFDIIQKRFDLLNSDSNSVFLKENRSKYRQHVLDNVENFKYTIPNSAQTSLVNDQASWALSMICDNARKMGNKIYLSGSGADEIICDYGFNGQKKFSHSNFGGLYPEDLSKIFPWPSFYGTTMYSYLGKEEYVAGSFGIETRYPYLDKHLVQEFLSLTHTLKNSKYKSVIDEYLTISNYPFEENVKRGF
tara:strand:+ start:1409 stop:2725 length:1317 start_codon:yes stop_codon:yes gene_type:complete